jgi:hypothetical protein
VTSAVKDPRKLVFAVMAGSTALDRRSAINIGSGAGLKGPPANGLIK